MRTFFNTPPNKNSIGRKAKHNKSLNGYNFYNCGRKIVLKQKTNKHKTAEISSWAFSNKEEIYIV